MQLTPRYGHVPVVTLDGPSSGIAEPTIRQRQRLLDALRGLSAEQWWNPSRCAGWSTKDVVVHLDSTNSFWVFSIQEGLRGEPTRFLETFDPVASPAELVAACADTGPDEVLERFASSNSALSMVLESLDEDDWSALAEAPPGHLPVTAVAHHALWDAWVHERDVLVPLGIEPVEEPDEIAACLRYAAALAPALAISRGSTDRGSFSVAATDPDVSFSVAVDGQVIVTEQDAAADHVLTGDAVGLVEALSIRAPLDAAVPPSAAWMFDGLAEVFEVDSV